MKLDARQAVQCQRLEGDSGRASWQGMLKSKTVDEGKSCMNRCNPGGVVANGGSTLAAIC